MDYKVHLIVGASASGKTTIGKELDKRGMEQLVSVTTRPIREGEVDGVDYHFVSEDEIHGMDLVESTVYAGNTYGLTREEVFEKTKYTDTYFITDKHGAEQIMDFLPDDCIYFWIEVTPELMLERMIGRGDSAENAVKRYHHAIKTGELEAPEIKHIKLDSTAHPKMNAYFIMSV